MFVPGVCVTNYSGHGSPKFTNDFYTEAKWPICFNLFPSVDSSQFLAASLSSGTARYFFFIVLEIVPFFSALMSKIETHEVRSSLHLRSSSSLATAVLFLPRILACFSSISSWRIQIGWTFVMLAVPKYRFSTFFPTNELPPVSGSFWSVHER